MKKLKFETTDEFERVFKKHDREITNSIVAGIEGAFELQRKNAKLFEISFTGVDLKYEISLPSSQWEIALESCMDHYRQLEESDSAIDVYLLQKEIRKWLN